MLKQDDSSSPEETSEPSRNRAQIAFIALPKLVAQRGFLDEDHEQMNHSPHQQSISDKQERAKEDGLPDYYRKNSKIHRVTPFPAGGGALFLVCASGNRHWKRHVRAHRCAETPRPKGTLSMGW